MAALLAAILLTSPRVALAFEPTWARLRIPPPVYLGPGEPFTGTVLARVARAGGGDRDADLSEIQGVLRMEETDVPVIDGRFAIRSTPAGQRFLQLFRPKAVGAELTRTTLMVTESASPRPAAGSPFLSPIAVLPGENILLLGPFEGIGDDPELVVGGLPCRLIWETWRGALFASPPRCGAGPGAAPIELRLRGSVAARGEIHCPEVTFLPPEPSVVSSRGEKIGFGARVQGLPPVPADYGPRDPMLELGFLNRDGNVLVDLWSKSPRVKTIEGDLFVPILPEIVGPDGSASVVVTAKGKTPGEIRIEGSVILPSRMTTPARPLAPASP